jgi:hypothetical protein
VDKEFELLLEPRKNLASGGAITFGSLQQFLG